jgi:alpha-amylase/alpha-mannosidase (GH57 family)|tara:strand:+ start:292 stop:591 length:300 start_codon:yes stop_codon:yes gene_type:complete
MVAGYRKQLVEYLKKNLSKGYTEESLKWALIQQKYSRTDIERAIEQAHKEIKEVSEKVSEVKEKPKIKYEIYDKDNKLIKVKLRKPFYFKKFLKNLFSS